MQLDDLTVAVAASIITGAISSLATVKSIMVHIDYLRAGQARVERAAERAHSRIDEISSYAASD